MRKYVPAYEGNLRKHALSVPRCISECSGIRVFGRRIKSLVFSTDVAIIKNINADAIIAVYPFTPQPAITQAIIGVSDERYNGRLPVPVRVIQDEWANVAQPDSYPKVLATCRSYNIGINIIVQNIQSIKALYKDEWEGIIGNCDTLLFLGGGNEPTSLEFVSKLLGKETVHTRTRGQTKGRSGSSSMNFQQTGRDMPYLFVKSSVALNLS